MTQIPNSHVADALTLTGADGRIDFFELTPTGGTGTLYFKNDNDVTWMGNTYTGLPIGFTGEKDSVTASASPRMTIGQPNLDLSMFKGLIRAGSLDDALIVRKTALLYDVIANNDIKISHTYRVGVVEAYGRSSISLQLRRFSGARRTTLPFRQYLPPAFPYVKI